MKIEKALILCAGLGKRLNPITLNTPKPLLELKNKSILEKCILMCINLGIKKILINTFHLGNQISEFIKNKKFPIEIELVEDGDKILDTGGGILNMMNHDKDIDFLIFNPDTLWDNEYLNEINEMVYQYFSKKLDNMLLVVNKELSFDKSLNGDFDFKNGLLKKNTEKNYIFIGCQILSKNLFQKHKVENFPIFKIWNKLLSENKLNAFESFKEFYHLTNLDTFKKLQDF